jgi:hypothetical protein
MITLNHEGVKLRTILRQPYLLRSWREYRNATLLCWVLSSSFCVQVPAASQLLDIAEGSMLFGVEYALGHGKYGLLRSRIVVVFRSRTQGQSRVIIDYDVSRTSNSRVTFMASVVSETSGFGIFVD